MSFERYFPIQLDISHYDSKVYIQYDIHPMTIIDSFPQPFHDQNTRQPSSSLVGKSQNCLVSNVMSLVYVAFMSCIYFIGWKYISLEFMGLMFHMSGLSFTTHGSNLKSSNLPGSLNCNCDLVAHSSLPMDPLTHGENIPLIFILCMTYILIFHSLVIFST